MRSAVVAVFLVGCGGDPFVGELFEGPDGTVELDGGAIVGTGGSSNDDAGTSSTGGRAPTSTGGRAATGGTSSTGGAPSSGGVASTGGASAGGAATGGNVAATGGVVGAGGTTVDACVRVTHSNGLGQTWVDCVPLGTHNATQALRACEAFVAASCPNARCTLPVGACTDGNNSAEYSGDCGDGHILWTFAPGYQSTGIGHVANTVCPTEQDQPWG